MKGWEVLAAFAIILILIVGIAVLPQTVFAWVYVACALLAGFIGTGVAVRAIREHDDA